MNENRNLNDQSSQKKLTDPELIALEQHLRQIQPRQAKLDLAAILAEVPPAEGRMPSSLVGDMPAAISSSPVLSASQLPASQISAQTPWRAVGTAWAGGMVMGGCLMFLLMGYFPQSPSSDPSSIANRLEHTETVGEEVSEAQPIPRAIELQTDPPNHPARQFLRMGIASSQTEIRSPLSARAGLGVGFSDFNGWDRREPWGRGLSSDQYPIGGDSTSPSNTASSESEYRLQIQLPPSTPTVSVHSLTQQLINEIL